MSKKFFQASVAALTPVYVKGMFAGIIGIFSFLVIILLIAFVSGWYISRAAEIKRYRRILMSQRDMASSYNVLKKDVDKILANFKSDKTEQSKITELEFLLKRVSENLEKMNKYVAQGIKVISKYDIINKIENNLRP